MTISFWLVFPKPPPRRRGIIAVHIIQHNPIAPAHFPSSGCDRRPQPSCGPRHASSQSSRLSGGCDEKSADANGRVVISWIGANLVGNSNDATVMEQTCSDGTTGCWAQWKAHVAESVNSHSASVKFTQSAASDHVIHHGTVSTSGLGSSANRNLGDFYQLVLDIQHRANISFDDDHLANPCAPRKAPVIAQTTILQSFG